MVEAALNTSHRSSLVANRFPREEREIPLRSESFISGLLRHSA